MPEPTAVSPDTTIIRNAWLSLSVTTIVTIGSLLLFAGRPGHEQHHAGALANKTRLGTDPKRVLQRTLVRVMLKGVNSRSLPVQPVRPR